MKKQLDHPFTPFEDRRDIDAFGKNVGGVWELNKILDRNFRSTESKADIDRGTA